MFMGYFIFCCKKKKEKKEKGSSFVLLSKSKICGIWVCHIFTILVYVCIYIHPDYSVVTDYCNLSVNYD